MLEPPNGITALTLTRSGVERSYQAKFAIQKYDAVVSYSGEGVGLAGERKGKVAFAPLWNLMCLLAEQSHTLAEGYRPNATFSYTPGILFDASFRIHRGDLIQSIHMAHREGPPILQVASLLLDLLLDQAIWESEPFTIQRDPPPPDYGRQKR